MLIDEIRACLAAKASALVGRRADQLDALIAPGFLYVNARGIVFDKAAYIETFCVSGRVVFKSQAAREIQVSDFGSFAASAFLLDDVFEAGGETVSAAYRSTATFARTPRGWLWAAGQTMSLPQN